MKALSKSIVAIALTAICVAAMAAPGVVGVWKGKISLGKPQHMNTANPQQMKVYEQMKAQLEKAVLVLTFMKNHTCTESDNMEKKTHKGTWSQSGRTITIVDGESKDAHKLTLNLSKNGKVLSASQQGASITFHRA